MKTAFLCMLSTGAVMSALTLVCLLLSPLLEKRYSPKGLYTACVVLMLGFLVPFSLLTPKPLVTVALPAPLSQPLFTGSATPQASTPAAAQYTSPVQAALATQAAAMSNAAPPLAAPAARLEAEPIRATTEGVIRQSGAGVSLKARLQQLDVLSLLGCVWLAGAVCFLGVQLLRHRRFMRTLHRWRRPCGNTVYLQTLSALQEDMSLAKRPDLYICEGVPSPMLIGLHRPAIYLPDEALTPDEIPLVLRHELVHYQRRDLLVKASLLLCHALHWYNPVMLPLSRWLGYCQEASCDSLVTRNTSEENRRFYSETILRVIRRQVHARTELCTSFYGGKEGMKKRIFSIMNNSKRRAGVVLCLCLVLGTLLCGGALALDGEMTLSFPQPAWVHAQSGTGTHLLTCPSANDITCPMGIYLNGTPVVIEQVTAGSSLPEWNIPEGEINWAEVIIGGDGYAKGIHGWMPLRDLTYESAELLPAAALKSSAQDAHTSLYDINDRETPPTALRPNGSEVRVLGRLNHWLHVMLEEESYFVLLNDTQLSSEADDLLWQLLPPRFGNATRAELDGEYHYHKAYEEKAALYGGKPVGYWSVEDKAWFSRLEAECYGSHDYYYYRMPGEGDLTEARAVEIALAVYAEKTGKETVTTEDVEVYPGFYSIGYTQPTYWEVLIQLKGDNEIIARITISNPDGQVLEINDTAPEDIFGLTPPEGNG